ncbi:hypothetical protein [Nostoc sp. NZL]|uniref:hypothetical protein n=1 Tax=Nostoc sp. NZL TaxID=2650612 RepID=UPI001E4C2B66|nr:hypothetical protein [Nostoc sp. NZL]
MPLLGAMSGGRQAASLREASPTRLRLFRHVIAKKVRWYLGLDIDPETQITVTSGSTEAMASVMLATVDDQVLF